MAAASPSPLSQMVRTTPTDYWNDSCATEELRYAIEHGAVGATSNPAIVLDVLRQELGTWRPLIAELAQAEPTASEVDVCWRLIETMAVRAAALLLPVFEREHGRKGRLSLQTNPTFYRNASAIVEQAVRFHSLAPNLQVKIPATKAGIAAIEEATRLGVNVNATVSFSVAQAIAVAEAVERGLDRRAADGGDAAAMAPVCTIMIGRIEDWLRVLESRDGVIADPSCIPWAGVACFKHAHAIFGERRFRTRLLAAAYRHQLHWTELAGGDVILTIPYVWQKRFNASGIEPRPRFHEPVAPAIVTELAARFPDFRRAYDERGLTLDELDDFGPVRRTLRSFVKAYYDLLGVVRDVMLPNPDVR